MLLVEALKVDLAAAALDLAALHHLDHHAARDGPARGRRPPRRSRNRMFTVFFSLSCK
jgi:hypothetical protein